MPREAAVPALLACRQFHPAPPRWTSEKEEEEPQVPGYVSAMMEFVDPYELNPDEGKPGRRWRASEIRLKSNEDLQKLWVVLLKERNMLYSTLLMHQKRKTQMPHRDRIKKCRKSMAMIKVVLGEREREAAARRASRQAGEPTAAAGGGAAGDAS